MDDDDTLAEPRKLRVADKCVLATTDAERCRLVLSHFHRHELILLRVMDVQAGDFDIAAVDQVHDTTIILPGRFDLNLTVDFAQEMDFRVVDVADRQTLYALGRFVMNVVCCVRIKTKFGRLEDLANGWLHGFQS